VAALPAGHSLTVATRTRLPLAALEPEIFILYRRPLGPGLYDAIIAACQRAGYSPRIGQEAPRLLATLSLVAAGLELARTGGPDAVVLRAATRMVGVVPNAAYRPFADALKGIEPLPSREAVVDAVRAGRRPFMVALEPRDSDT